MLQHHYYQQYRKGLPLLGLMNQETKIRMLDSLMFEAYKRGELSLRFSSNLLHIFSSTTHRENYKPPS